MHKKMRTQGLLFVIYGLNWSQEPFCKMQDDIIQQVFLSLED